MSDAPVPPIKEHDGVPFLYFDHVVSFGHINGVIQLELSANILTPIQKGVEVQITPVARLRCNVPAAADVLQAIQNALEMAQQAQQGGSTGPSQVN